MHRLLAASRALPLAVSLALTSLIALSLAPADARAQGAATTTSSSTPAPLKAGGTVTTQSGLVFQLLKEGSGASPLATDMVKVHYRGTLMDGTEFDSSHKRGEPAQFPLNRVIKCWTEGLQLMKVGATARLTCPPEIAYGPRAVGGVIPPNATLRFEVELLGIGGK